jgi:uncharacterized protein (DUF1697 family)
MPTVVSMLRGVNLAAHNRIRMDALRALYESLGLGEVRSYLQSGNILYSTRRRDLDLLARHLEKKILESHGIRTTVVQRLREDLCRVVERNPFAERAGVEPARLAVSFLTVEPSAAAREAALAIPIAPEEMFILGREMFLYYPNGMGRSKLPVAKIEKTLGAAGTARNWNTVTALLELAGGAAVRT